ncbi:MULTISPECIES: Gfo/Idh/MocA family protein [Haloarcula]|uniref:Oxidoreductase n=1 Tax=Haloarcula pellucida TaxID=1427151 RepID=A0A830GRM1_9EURY|nr:MULTISPECIES: Gfo/Idh/MocA family oxidoreductase [Halomicroarcula]MBX0350235.1 Gfo/Idh/MocA family oxidoreductase [Halomicroarcula pellucida]MDS0277663.1 Gfo/Idh/MocA family oxidoreductase [Halomicroarcula sp. S1AR25-4]GGO01044.1 oxidoreductase [Halomicroarcula pellucida]
MTELAVGVVGAGWMATDYHVPAFTSHPDTRVVAVAERDDARRSAVERDLSVPGYADAEAMLAAHGLDVVSICTPPSTHEGIFLDAVDAGCHVLCEKPLALTAESARRMAEAADAAGVVTQVGYLHRYYRNYERALEMLSNHLLGDVVEVTVAHHSAPPQQGWYYDPDLAGGGVARDLFPHSLDVLFETFGEDATVTAADVRHLRGHAVEDTARVSLEIDEVPVDLSATWTQTDGVTRVLVVGTEGWLELDAETLRGEVHGRPIEFQHGDLPLVDVGVATLFPAGDEDAHTARIHDFADHAAAGDTETAAPASRGVAVAEVIDAVYERTGAAWRAEQ